MKVDRGKVNILSVKKLNFTIVINSVVDELRLCSRKNKDRKNEPK